MWPWGHLGLGYLLARASVPTDQVRGAHLLAVALGTQFPDLVDKPLAWTFTILPSGRSLAHSVFALVVVVGFAWVVCRRYDRPTLAVVFGIGYASHLLGDSLHALVGLEWEFLTFLVWPLLELPPYENDSSFVSHFLNFELGAWTLFGFALFATAAVLVVHTERQHRR
ncbi:metal-dependent hydrolase [Halorubellus litoreus]|uniref:Metal-dependent hydrolase n=1 Tax=Halorubellus litoreus TaxID=755308 RepID=A0ABD5VGV7_9EURY